MPNRARGTLRHGASAITKATRALWAHDGHASVAMYDNLAALAAGRMDALSAYKVSCERRGRHHRTRTASAHRRPRAQVSGIVAGVMR